MSFYTSMLHISFYFLCVFSAFRCPEINVKAELETWCPSQLPAMETTNDDVRHLRNTPWLGHKRCM